MGILFGKSNEAKGAGSAGGFDKYKKYGRIKLEKEIIAKLPYNDRKAIREALEDKLARGEISISEIDKTLRQSGHRMDYIRQRIKKEFSKAQAGPPKKREVPMYARARQLDLEGEQSLPPGRSRIDEGGRVKFNKPNKPAGPTGGPGIGGSPPMPPSGPPPSGPPAIPLAG